MNTKKTIKGYKRHLMSALVTFISAFTLTLGSLVYAADFNVIPLDSVFLMAVCATAFRAGVKGVAEYIVNLK